MAKKDTQQDQPEYKGDFASDTPPRQHIKDEKPPEPAQAKVETEVKP